MGRREKKMDWFFAPGLQTNGVAIPKNTKVAPGNVSWEGSESSLI